MSTEIEIAVPDIGDFEDVEVIEVLASPGQQVAAEDGLITIETDKAAMDVPAPQAGEIVRFLVTAGDKVSMGSVIAVLRIADSAAEPAEQSDTPEATQIMAGIEASDAETVAVPTLSEIKVPNLGDFDDVEVIEVLVKVGDSVSVDSSLVTLETDKAAMDIPSPYDGVIKELSVTLGARVSEGDLLAICEVIGGATDAPEEAPASAAPVQNQEATTVVATSSAPRPSVAAVPAVLPAINESTFGQAHASPAVRKFARELGVDLGRVQGSGVKNRISKPDVKAFVKAVMSGGISGGGAAALPEVPKVDHAKFGEISLEPLTRIQKISGPRLHASWVNVPHVTQNEDGDFTDTEKTRKEMKAKAKEDGISLTPLAFVLRACVLALQEFPLFNASMSDDKKSMVMKSYINLGFAADTPNGLVVPVIHNAQDLSVLELAAQLGELSALAREGKLKATQMQGGTFTVSSLGGIGGTSFTPIINAPEVAILGVSRSKMQPVYIDGEFVPRLLLPLSLSYDHRVIDGASAARFAVRLADIVSKPEGLLAHE